MLVTAAEGAALYAWLRLFLDGREVLAYVVLFVGENLETLIVALPLQWATTAIPNGDPFGLRLHQRRTKVLFSIASVGELLIWFIWLTVATEVGQEEAAVVLLVLMHLKHQLEASTLRDLEYFQDFWTWKGTVASVAETAGAVACFALLDQGELELAAAALAAGLLLEHILLMSRLYEEVEERDVSVPRLRRPPEPLWLRALAFFGKRIPRFWRALQSIGPLDRRLNVFAIDTLVRRVPGRPNPLSTMAPYPSWASLTDRTWSSRHLPPSAAGVREHPALDKVADVFRREKFEACAKSTVLFASFAQWFIDGFLRTRREAPGVPRNTLRNESNHEMDLSQLYGLNSDITNALRIHDGGRLKCAPINGEDYPERLCVNGDRRAEFAPLFEPIGFQRMQRDEKNRLFAMGTDVHSVGFTAFNVLFLREHNKIAGKLESAYGWGDQELFDKARNVLTVLLLKLVVVEYVNHITGYWPRYRFPRAGAFKRAPWFRQNWMAVEFNLLYRWHPLIPTTLHFGGQDLNVNRMLDANDVLTANGLRAFMLAATEQPAGRVGLFNTEQSLVDDADVPSIRQARDAKLRSFNDYRELAGKPRLRHFGEFSTDKRVGKGLNALYDHVDDVEFYVGLFAEEPGRYEVLPPLMTQMVAFDAFSQLLTNPLLAPRVYGEEALSEVGLAIVRDTNDLDTLIKRNVPQFSPEDRFSMKQRDYSGP